MTLDGPLPANISFRSIALIALAIMTSACVDASTRETASLTTFPSEVTIFRATSDGVTTDRQGTTFPLLNGSFRLTFRGADSGAGAISGAYTGTAVGPRSGGASATLEMSIRRATGVASDVTALAAEGTGSAFLGEGDFTLSLKLSPEKGSISTKLRGTSTVVCSANHRILVTMHGTGSTSKLGDVEVELRHEVGNTVCGSVI